MLWMLALFLLGCNGPAAVSPSPTPQVTVEAVEEGPQPLVGQLPRAPLWNYDIVERYPHDPKAFTQGLLCDGQGVLYESTGQRGHSSLRRLDLKAGTFEILHSLPADQFGEGLALVKDQFFWLTWDSQICHVLNRQGKPQKTFRFEGEGWGLCAQPDGRLWMSNGSARLVLRSAEDFSILREVEVRNAEGQAIPSLNELEWVEGKIYANLWGTQKVAVIDPQDGRLEAYIDLSGLLSASESRQADVLNGMAYDPKEKRLWVTGKLWPRIFEVRVRP